MNSAPQHQASVIRLLVALASIIIIIAGIRSSASLLNSLLLGLFLALIALPMQQALRQRGMSSLLATSLVIGGVVVVLLGLIWLLSISLSELSIQLPVYQQNLVRQFDVLREVLVNLGFNRAASASLPLPRLSNVVGWVIALLGGLVSTGWFIFLVFLVFSYTIAETESFAARFHHALGSGSFALLKLNAFTATLSTFIARQAVLGGAAAACDMLLLWFMGIDFPLLWGVLSFLCSFVPNLGYYIALVPPMVLGFIEFGPSAALTVFLGYLIINTFFDNLIYPRYMGAGLNLSSLVTFFACLFWAWVLGPVGALLSLPLTLLVKLLVLEYYPDSAWLATIISNDVGAASPEISESETPTPEAVG